MPRKPQLSEAQIDRICHLRETNRTHGEIARMVGCSINQSRWWCRERGAVGRLDVEDLAQRPARVDVMVRRGRAVRPFTPAERVELLAHAQSPHYASLGRQLGRAPNSVRAFFKGLARVEAIRELLQ
jgi:hypothetical protein